MATSKKKTSGKKKTTRKRASKKTTRKLSREERIRHRAYELYLERGRTGGSPADDWRAAEKEIDGASRGD